LTSSKIIGISAFYHDSAAALLIDGKLIAAAQEERFSRKKHDASFPIQSIIYCLQTAGLTVTDVDQFVFYDKPLLKFERILQTYLKFAPRGYESFRKSMPLWLKQKLFIKRNLRDELSQIDPGLDATSLELLFASHHESHAASAFFPSPFKEAAVLCVDGVGEWATTSAWVGDSNRLEQLWQIDFPHSLGLLYSSFTAYCGFQVNSGEYKLMGLAPYGQPIFVQKILDNLIDVKDDGSFRLNMKYFDFPVGLSMFNENFNSLFGGAPRLPEKEITQRDMDLAASVQSVLEFILKKLVSTVHNQTGKKNLCLAGGVALNCVANGKLQSSSAFENIWIQPAAGDAGGAVGAAYACYHTHLNRQRIVEKSDGMSGCLLGPEFSNEQIKVYLESVNANYEFLQTKQLCSTVAKLISEGDVVAWFQGRMEFGPRALGARSILGDPRSKDMQSHMNMKIKFRESFRPFAPMVLEKMATKYFQDIKPSPYMLFVYGLQKNQRLTISASDEKKSGFDRLSVNRSLLPAITHVNQTARVQTVRESPRSILEDLLIDFTELTGVPVLINTSFNVRGEPIVCSPKDAFECFLSTEIDVLVMGNFILRRLDQANSSSVLRDNSQFAPD
jgi:carbamoyltransferase